MHRKCVPADNQRTVVCNIAPTPSLRETAPHIENKRPVVLRSLKDNMPGILKQLYFMQSRSQICGELVYNADISGKFV